MTTISVNRKRSQKHKQFPDTLPTTQGRILQELDRLSVPERVTVTRLTEEFQRLNAHVERLADDCVKAAKAGNRSQILKLFGLGGKATLRAMDVAEQAYSMIEASRIRQRRKEEKALAAQLKREGADAARIDREITARRFQAKR